MCSTIAGHALQKIGAVHEAVRRAFVKDGLYQDQLLWATSAADWNDGQPRHTRGVH